MTWRDNHASSADLSNGKFPLDRGASLGGAYATLADLAVAGPAGQGFNFRGAWTASTAYASYDVVTYSGQSYVATAAFTSGSTFDATHFSLIAAKGNDGASSPGGSVAVATKSSTGTVKPDPHTLDIASDGTLSAVFMAVTPRAFGAITDGGKFGDGGSHPASANGFATLAALQAVYSFATALSNDMAGLMIQAAVNFAHANNYRKTLLDAGQYRNLPNGIVMPSFSNTRLVGTGRNTVILCSPCGSNPGMTINGSGCGLAPVEGVAFWGFDNKSFGDTTTGSSTGVGNNRGGNPDPMLYTAGSIGLSISNISYLTFKDLYFQNLDRTVSFTNTGNNYIVAFERCIFELNNIGWSIENYNAVNSYEKMSLRNCTIGNNNTGLLVQFGDGGSNGVAGDLTLYDCSLDYNIQRHINYVGALKYINERPNSVRMIGGHMETNSATSGGASTYRVFNNGDFRMFDVEVTEGGESPYALIVHGDNAAASSVNDCRQPYTSFSWVYVGNTQGLVTGGSNSGGPLAAADTGFLYTPTIHPSKQQLGSDQTFYGNASNSPGAAFLITATMSLTIPVDSANFQYMSNTGFIFRTLPGATCTFVQGSGVTITSSGTGLTFGGSKPAQVSLTKTAGNTWIATGQMT